VRERLTQSLKDWTAEEKLAVSLKVNRQEKGNPRRKNHIQGLKVGEACTKEHLGMNRFSELNIPRKEAVWQDARRPRGGKRCHLQWQERASARRNLVRNKERGTKCGPRRDIKFGESKRRGEDKIPEERARNSARSRRSASRGKGRITPKPDARHVRTVLQTTKFRQGVSSQISGNLGPKPECGLGWGVEHQNWLPSLTR